MRPARRCPPRASKRWAGDRLAAHGAHRTGFVQGIADVGPGRSCPGRRLAARPAGRHPVALATRGRWRRDARGDRRGGWLAHRADDGPRPADAARVGALAHGFLLWWPTKRVGITTGRSPFRTWFDLHNLVGIVSLVFLLLLSLTGVFIGFSDVMIPLAYRVTGSRPVSAGRDESRRRAWGDADISPTRPSRWPPCRRCPVRFHSP